MKDIGSDRDLYIEGDALKVVYYKQELNIIDKVPIHQMPDNVRRVLGINSNVGEQPANSKHSDRPIY